MRRRLFVLPVCAVAALALCIASARASTFANITIDDNYDDWIGIPELELDPADTTTGPDIRSIQVANDNTYLYIRLHYETADSFPTYLGIDNDNNAATGYNVFGAGLIGSEAAYADDFDFDQRAGFNIGTLKDPVRLTEPESGSAILSSFVESTDREMAIRLDTTFDPFVGAGDVFPNNSFTLLFYTLDAAFGQADITDPIPYTLAVPEPGSLLLLGCGVALVACRRGKTNRK
jgi:hypothetical protein